MKRNEFIKLMGLGSVALTVAPLSIVSANSTKELNQIPIKKPFDKHKPIYPDYISSWVKSQETDNHITTGTYEESFHSLTYVPTSTKGKYTIVRESWYLSDNMTKKEIEKENIKRLKYSAEQVKGKKYFDINKIR